MSKGCVRVWHKNFLQGQECIKDGPRTGRPRTARSEEKRAQAGEFLQANRAVNLQHVAEHLDISVTSAHRLLKKDMKLSKLSLKFVPKDLTQAQKDVQKSACERNLQRLKDDPTILDRLVTGDESWVSVFEVPTKRQSSQWLPKGTHGDRPQKALLQRSERKSMLTLFFDKKGMVLAEFAPRGQRINAEAYCDTIKTLKECLRRKRPQLWKLPGGACDQCSSTMTMPPPTPRLQPWIFCETATWKYWNIHQICQTWLPASFLPSLASKTHSGASDMPISRICRLLCAGS